MHQESGTPEEDEGPVPPIMRLPREVRGLIFNRLPQLEMICLRYVCKAWRDEVDDFCEFSVILDDRRPKWLLERVMDLRIRKCKVVNFMEPLATSGFFRYPGLLRSLKIVTEKITPENFQSLLKDTSPHLREFCGVLNRPILQYSGYLDNFPVRFENLRRLRLSVSTMPGNDGDEEPVRGPPTFSDQLFHKIFGGGMKSIKMLAVEIRCLGAQQCSRLSSLVLAFIGNHYETLEHVDFDLIQGHGVPLSFNEVRPLNDSDLERIDFRKLRKCSALQSIRLVNSTAVGVDILQSLLASQKHLQFMETDILPAPNQLYKQVVLNNEQTLVHIDIGDLTIDLDSDDENMRRFDCQIFQNCKQLRKLTLDRDTSRRRPFGGFGGDLAAELINLHCLPEYLEELNLNYFLLLSDELLILFSGEGPRENLKTLALTQCGDSGDFGVDGSVLEKVISMKSIDFIEVSPLNFTYPEESRKLNQILTTFGYSEGHSYFQLSRISQNFQINFEDFNP